MDIESILVIDERSYKRKGAYMLKDKSPHAIMSHHRFRAPGKTKRSHKIPLGFNDEEYQLLLDAAQIKGISPSYFIAEYALREAARVLKKVK